MSRVANIGSVGYAPGRPPTDPTDIMRFMREELDRVNAAINLLAAGHLDKTTVAPTRPREGDMRFADGTYWNPGSGQGFYAYYGGAWHFLG